MVSLFAKVLLLESLDLLKDKFSSDIVAVETISWKLVGNYFIWNCDLYEQIEEAGHGEFLHGVL